MTKQAGLTVWLEDGTPINMKHISSLPAKVLWQYEKLYKLELPIEAVTYLMQKAVTNQSDLKKIDELTLAELVEFVKSWSDQCLVE